ncbi:MAG: protocatechuate 3,4-dioxygenase [Nannocystaceae bacterium]|nr:protocatechuate 3,4-dioxygenase [Nannocystaceae bacterium]
MISKREATTTMGRRKVLHAMGATVVVLGCGVEGGAQDEGSSEGDGEGSGDASASSGSEASSSGSGSSDGADGSSDATGTPQGCEAASAWASGGTASMTAKDCYPDPFAAGVSACALLCETTEGPCTADTIERQDVSEGWSGLPVRLSLKIVTADTCEPVEGAFVEIWHTQRTGVYSGETPSGMMCYGDDPDAVNYLYFRGSQTTDANGRVDFDTCYPGWYSSRAVHIHFRVIVGSDEFLTSQLFFDDALSAEIFAEHPEYAEFGQPDTTNDTDNVIGGEADKTPYVLETQRMADGAMLASKVIAVRSSPDDALCSAQGAGGGGAGGP